MSSISPDCFLGNNPPERIIGSETEYSISFQTDHNLKKILTKNNLEKKGISITTRGFSDANGARIYRDGACIEVSSPECRGPIQATIYDFASIEILRIILENEESIDAYRSTGIDLRFKGNPINAYTTQGHHENYMFPSETLKKHFFQPIIGSYLASKIWSGVGTMKKNKFIVSQKLPGIGNCTINEDQSNESIIEGKKPMYFIPSHTTDRDTISYGNDNKWSRLEVRFADANFSRKMKYLGFAASSIILRLLEHTDKLSIENIANNSFKNILGSAGVFYKDLTFNKTSETISSKQITALNYQEILLEQAIKLSNMIKLPVSETQSFQIWQDTIDALKKSNLSNHQYDDFGLKNIDFFIKHYYLFKKYGDQNFSTTNPNLMAGLISYDQIYPNVGIAYKYWQKVNDTSIADEDIVEATKTPPNTRAKKRASIIEANLDLIDHSSWPLITLTDGREFTMNDPYQ